MKSKRSDKTLTDLDAVIASGKAAIEKTNRKGKVGRPGSEVPKRQCGYYLPKNIVDALESVSRYQANKSVFITELIISYLEDNGIKY